MRKFLTLIFAAALILLTCAACRDNNEDPSFHYISDGTLGSIIKEPVPDDDYAEFYVPTGMVTLYASKDFTKDERELYDTLLKEMGHFEDKVVMNDSSDIYSKILDIIRVEQLGHFQVKARRGELNVETMRYDLIFEYRFDNPKTMSDMNLEVEKVADTIVANITPDMSVYDKLKFFHDYLIKNCTSDIEAPYADTIYGTLINHKAICEGYTKTFSYLCNKVGIENMIATGYTTVPHMWNMVKVNGNWYHIDVTWDKPHATLLESYPDAVLYQYFMVTDSVIENDHTIRTEHFTPPKAYDTEGNYFIRENRYVNSVDEFLAVAESALIDAVKNRESSAMVKFDSTDLYLTVTSRLNQPSVYSESKELSDVKDNISKEFGIELSISRTELYSANRVLMFVIKYEDE